MKKFLGALLIATLASAGAFAFDEVSAVSNGLRSGHPDDLTTATEQLHDAVNDHFISNEQIHNQTFHFSNVGLPATKIGIKFQLHPWAEYDAPEGKNATVYTIMFEGDKALHGAKTNPPTEVWEANSRGEQMFRDGKIDFGQLGDNQAGEYQYKSQEKVLGHIDLNEFFKVMARLIQPKLLYATVIHEARHAQDHMDGKLSPTEVKKGEISAFKSEYLYLATISRNGEEIATSWMRLDDLAKRTHNPIAARAADYVFSLLALYRTKGDEKKLIEYVDKMGYQEGSGRQKTSPFSS